MAKQFAMTMHDDRGQRYGEYPYWHHLEQVVNVLLRHDVVDRNILAAGWLHDILEDTEVSLELVAKIFGNEVSSLVYAVTDEPGATRKERKAKTYEKTAKNREAVMVKIADRIANIEFSIKTKNERMFRMYCKEHTEFTKALDVYGENSEMWAEYNQLIYTGLDQIKK